MISRIWRSANRFTRRRRIKRIRQYKRRSSISRAARGLHYRRKPYFR